MVRVLAIILLAFTVINSHAQRFSVGYRIGTGILKRVDLKSNVILPENSWFTFYTENEKKDDEPVFDYWGSDYHAGLSFQLDYRAFSLFFDPMVDGGSQKVPLFYYTRLGALLDQNWTTLIVRRSSFKLPLYLSYKFLKSANGPFILGGLRYSMDSYAEPAKYNLDAFGGINPGVVLYISDYELYNIMYDEHNYWEYMFGFGWKGNNSWLSVRFNNRLPWTAHDIQADIWNIEWTFSQYLNFQKLKKGHKLYIE